MLNPISITIWGPMHSFRFFACILRLQKIWKSSNTLFEVSKNWSIFSKLYKTTGIRIEILRWREFISGTCAVTNCVIYLSRRCHTCVESSRFSNISVPYMTTSLRHLHGAQTKVFRSRLVTNLGLILALLFLSIFLLPLHFLSASIIWPIVVSQTKLTDEK